MFTATLAGLPALLGCNNRRIGPGEQGSAPMLSRLIPSTPPLPVSRPSRPRHSDVRARARHAIILSPPATSKVPQATSVVALTRSVTGCVPSEGKPRRRWHVPGVSTGGDQAQLDGTSRHCSWILPATPRKSVLSPTYRGTGNLPGRGAKQLHRQFSPRTTPPRSGGGGKGGWGLPTPI